MNTPAPTASASVDATTSPARLRAIAALLAEPCQRIETAFVDVGARLTQCAGLLNRITIVFEALPKDLESRELSEATDRLAAVGRRAREISASFAGERGAIAELVEVVAAAGHPISDLRKAVRMMGIVAINARVVAASVIDELNGFDIFTTDIATLSESATRTIHDFSLTYEQLSNEVRRAAGQRAHFETTHRDTLGDLAARLEENLTEITGRRRAAAEGSAETGRVSRDISARISAAVMALQVGDATRQRLEHVEAALESAAILLSGKPSGGIALDAAELPSMLEGLAELETAQLAGATSDFATEVTEAEGALQDLAVNAQTVMARSRELYGQADRGEESSLARLGAEMRQAATMLRDCEAERSKLDQVAAAVGATVKVLLEHVEAVQEIEANMRLVSLNAAIKCAQLGPRGRALNVIAQQLRELTGGTVLAAEAAMSNLGRAATLAASFSAAASGDAAGQVGRLEQEASASIALLETVDRRLSEAMTILNQDGPAASQALELAAASMSGHADIAETMADAQFHIASLAAGDKALPRSAGVMPLFALLQKSYSMEAERLIHQRIIGHFPAATMAGVPAEADSGLEDILF